MGVDVSSIIQGRVRLPEGESHRTLGDGADRGVTPRARSRRDWLAADRKLEARYTVAYIAHAPLEPRAAVAQWKGGKLTVWTGTQRPFKVRDQLTEAFHLPENQVRVIVPDTGSGYGGKHTGECAIQAARLAKAAGRPVKLDVDPRRGIYLGLLPSRRSHRGDERC